MAVTLSWETFLGRFNLSKDYQLHPILAEEKATATVKLKSLYRCAAERIPKLTFSLFPADDPEKYCFILTCGIWNVFPF